MEFGVWYGVRGMEERKVRGMERMGTDVGGGLLCSLLPWFCARSKHNPNTQQPQQPHLGDLVHILAVHIRLVLQREDVRPERWAIGGVRGARLGSTLGEESSARRQPLGRSHDLIEVKRDPIKRFGHLNVPVLIVWWDGEGRGGTGRHGEGRRGA